MSVWPWNKDVVVFHADPRLLVVMVCAKGSKFVAVSGHAPHSGNMEAVKDWWKQIDKWRKTDSLKYEVDEKTIKPQHAIERLYELTKDVDTFITTEVGQHQMWAAQYYKFTKPNRWITSGALGTMGFGLPAAIGAQVAHPDKLVIDIAGEASILMCMQEMSTALQHKLPVKIFIINTLCVYSLSNEFISQMFLSTIFRMSPLFYK